MRIMRRAIPFILCATVLAATPAPAADDSKVKAATDRVDKGARMMGDGEILKGAEETAKGIGFTVYEGAKFTGEKFKEAGKAAYDSPTFIQGVTNFFSRLFTN